LVTSGPHSREKCSVRSQRESSWDTVFPATRRSRGRTEGPGSAGASASARSPAAGARGLPKPAEHGRPAPPAPSRGPRPREPRDAPSGRSARNSGGSRSGALRRVEPEEGRHGLGPPAPPPRPRRRAGRSPAPAPDAGARRRAQVETPAARGPRTRSRRLMAHPWIEVGAQQRTRLGPQVPVPVPRRAQNRGAVANGKRAAVLGRELGVVGHGNTRYIVAVSSSELARWSASATSSSEFFSPPARMAARSLRRGRRRDGRRNPQEKRSPEIAVFPH